MRRAFTDPTLAARWWHPRHFTISAFHFDANLGGGKKKDDGLDDLLKDLEMEDDDGKKK